MAEEKFFRRFQRHKALTASVSALMLLAIFFAIGGPVRLDQLTKRQIPVSAPTVLEANAPIDPIIAFREDRQAARQEELDQLNAIIDNEKTSQEMRSAAQRQILDLCDWMEKEATLEGVLRVRGFEELIVTVHTDSVNVLLRTDGITRGESALILELAMRETGMSGGNIKIIPVK